MNELRRRVMHKDEGGLPLGVWAYYSDGTLKDYDHADTNAIGVAIITSELAFVVSKAYTRTTFGGSGIDLSGLGIVCTSNQNTALQDFDGKGNTEKLVNYLGESANAAFWCTLNGSDWYLGSIGEMHEIYNHKTDAIAMMSKIGGYFPTNQYYWSSTLTNASSVSYALNLNSGAIGNNGARTYTNRVHALIKLR